MYSEILAKRDEVAALCRQYGVARLEIFGSAARSADFDSGRSDLDFLVKFEPVRGHSALGQYIGFAEALEKLFGRRVDLVEREAIETSRNFIRRNWILREAETLYG